MFSVIISSSQEVELLSPLKTSCRRQLSQLPSGFLCLIAEGEQESPEFKRQREEYSEVWRQTSI